MKVYIYRPYIWILWVPYSFRIPGWRSHGIHLHTGCGSSENHSKGAHTIHGTIVRIFTDIYHKNQANVGTVNIPYMDIKSLYFHGWIRLKSLPKGMPWTQPENATWHGGDRSELTCCFSLDLNSKRQREKDTIAIYPMILEKRFGARHDVFFY